jgi:hypothetical protein
MLRNSGWQHHGPLFRSHIRIYEKYTNLRRPFTVTNEKWPPFLSPAASPIWKGEQEDRKKHRPLCQLFWFLIQEGFMKSTEMLHFKWLNSFSFPLIFCGWDVHTTTPPCFYTFWWGNTVASQPGISRIFSMADSKHHLHRLSRPQSFH